MKPYHRPLAERFAEKVNRNGPTQPHMTTPCWEWIGGRIPEGYGVISRDGRSVGAHRVAWELANGPIPDGLRVLHRCDYPPCVRSEPGGVGHLFLGTPAANTADMVAKGRAATGDRHNSRTRPETVLRGEAHGAAVLTNAQVLELRQRRASGESWVSLGRAFGVSKQSAYRAGTGRAWSHLPGAVPVTRSRASQR